MANTVVSMLAPSMFLPSAVDFLEAAAAGGSPSIAAAPTAGVGSQRQAYTMSNGTLTFSGLAATGIQASLAGNPLYVSTYFQTVALPTGGNNEVMRLIASTSTLKMSVRLETSGVLAVYDSAGVLVATGTTVLAVNTTYRLDLKGGNGTTAAYELRIATGFTGTPAVELSGTCDQGASNVTRYQIGQAVKNSGNNTTFKYWEIVADTAGYAPDRYRIGTLLPVSDGATQQWTGGTNSSNFAEIDEAPGGMSKADYVADPSAAATVTGTWAVQAFAASDNAVDVIVATTIVAVATYALVSDGASVVNTFSAGLRSNATDALTNTRNTPASTSHDWIGKIHMTDPNTAAAWLQAAVEAALLKVTEGTSSVSTRLYAMHMVVMYIPPLVTSLIEREYPRGATRGVLRGAA